MTVRGTVGWGRQSFAGGVVYKKLSFVNTVLLVHTEVAQKCTVFAVFWGVGFKY
jgi:hypothetical protein